MAALDARLAAVNAERRGKRGERGGAPGAGTRKCGGERAAAER